MSFESWARLDVKSCSQSKVTRPKCRRADKMSDCGDMPAIPRRPGLKRILSVPSLSAWLNSSLPAQRSRELVEERRGIVGAGGAAPPC